LDFAPSPNFAAGAKANDYTGVVPGSLTTTATRGALLRYIYAASTVTATVLSTTSTTSGPIMSTARNANGSTVIGVGSAEAVGIAYHASGDTSEQFTILLHPSAYTTFTNSPPLVAFDPRSSAFICAMRGDPASSGTQDYLLWTASPDGVSWYQYVGWHKVKLPNGTSYPGASTAGWQLESFAITADGTWWVVIVDAVSGLLHSMFCSADTGSSWFLVKAWLRVASVKARLTTGGAGLCLSENVTGLQRVISVSSQLSTQSSIASSVI
jgi:hypothetical protein